MREFDVIVAGGGVAGVAASVASARQGARTLLVERSPELGGTAGAAMLRQVCGLYANGPSGPSTAEDTLNPGLQREVAAMLMDRGSPGPQRVGRVHVLPFEPGDMTAVLDDLCRAEGLLSLTLGASVRRASVQPSDDSDSPSGSGARSVLSMEDSMGGPAVARAFVDATGSAGLALMAGARTHLSQKKKRQLAGYTVRVENLAPGSGSLHLEVPYRLRRAAEAGALPESFCYTQFSPGARPGEGYLKFSIAEGEGFMAVRGTGRERSPLRMAVNDAMVYLGSHIEAFGAARIAGAVTAATSREGRRVDGAYIMTAEDILESRGFGPDEVCRAAWPMELWEPRKGPRYRYPRDDGGYGVPLGCLRARGFDNLFAAGMSASATREAMGSLRVMGACIATGEQAGIAAASRAMRTGA